MKQPDFSLLLVQNTYLILGYMSVDKTLRGMFFVASVFFAIFFVTSAFEKEKKDV